MKAIQGDSQKLGSFLEWMGEQGFVIAVRHKHTGSADPDEPSGCWEAHTECTASCFCTAPKPHNPADMGRKCICKKEVDNLCGFSQNELAMSSMTTEKLLAKYFEIDLQKVDDEKRAILDTIGGA